MSETSNAPFYLTDDQFESLFGKYLVNLEKKINSVYAGRNTSSTAVAIQNKFPERDSNYVAVVNSCPRNNVNLSDIKFDTVSKTYRRPIALDDLTKEQLKNEIEKIENALSETRTMDTASKDALVKILGDQKKVYEDRLKCL
jgi:hypothetical protein